MVTTWFSVVFLFVACQRLIELQIAKRNAAHIRSLGGYEVGAAHYPFLVAMHAVFFIFLFVEVHARGQDAAAPLPLPFALFLLAQVLRVWCLATLGKFWNTRIFVLPGSRPVVRGPYRYLRHPNYTVVTLELLTLPLAFGAPLTALVFSLLNLAILRVRIRIEEAALSEVTEYDREMAQQLRFFPSWKK